MPRNLPKIRTVASSLTQIASKIKLAEEIRPAEGSEVSTQPSREPIISRDSSRPTPGLSYIDTQQYSSHACG